MFGVERRFSVLLSSFEDMSAFESIALEGGEHGDVAQYYNAIFVPVMATFVLSLRNSDARAQVSRSFSFDLRAHRIFHRSRFQITYRFGLTLC